jgi:hypothetical protein
MADPDLHSLTNLAMVHHVHCRMLIELGSGVEREVGIAMWSRLPIVIRANGVPSLIGICFCAPRVLSAARVI